MMRIAMLAGVVALAAGGPMVRAADVTVFAAASLSDALKAIRVQYARAHPEDRVAFNFDASSTLARQIIAGAPADLFFSADEAKMDQVQAKGLIEEMTRRSVLSNVLVIVAAAVDGVAVTAPEDLAGAAVKTVALANPETVPAGIYARAYLRRVRLWEAVAPKVVPVENVRAALAAVEAGNADAAFVYRTDAAISKQVQVVYTVDPQEGPSITYPLAVLAGTKHGDAARRFAAYLQSPAAADMFRKFGFTVLQP